MVYLSIPENVDRFKLAGEDLISVLKDREIKKQMVEKENRKERERPE